MAQISGIPVEYIGDMYGVNVTSIVSIGGISTSSIPGWPSGGGCITLSLGYTSEPPIPQVCRNPRDNYEFDLNTNVLFNIGEPCGGAPAPDGFYSNGRTINSWFLGVWNIVGPC